MSSGGRQSASGITRQRPASMPTTRAATETGSVVACAAPMEGVAHLAEGQHVGAEAVHRVGQDAQLRQTISIFTIDRLMPVARAG